MADNFRHAQYRADGTQIDDPQRNLDLTEAQLAVLQTIANGNNNRASEYAMVRGALSTGFWSLVNGGGATGSMTAVQTNTPFRRPALRVVIPNDTGTVDVIADGLALPNFTAGRGNVVITVYVENELGIKQWQVHAGNDASLTRNMSNTYNLSNNNIQRANGHHVVSLNPGNATANTLLTTDSVDRVRLRFFGQSAGTVVWVEGIFVPLAITPWMVVTFDDADISLYDRTHVELAKRGLRATFGVNWDDGVSTPRTGVGAPGALFVTASQIAEMYAYGHDITSHNIVNTAYPDENPPTAQPSAADRQTYLTAFLYTRNKLRSLGYDRGLGYHPAVQGAHDGALVDLLKDNGVKIVRTTGPGHTEAFWAHRHNTVKQRQLGNGSNLATAQGWVDTAKTYGQDFFLMGHILAATASDSITWAQTDFASLLDYARDQGIRTGSVSEWASARGFNVN